MKAEQPPSPIFDYLRLFPLALGLFLTLDFLWLLAIAPELYRVEMGALLRPDPNMIPAFAFYLLFVAGLTYFVLIPAWVARSILKAGISGAAFGLICYATYDLTALAVITGFSTKIALIDLAWGGVVSGITSSATLRLALLFWGRGQ